MAPALGQHQHLAGVAVEAGILSHHGRDLPRLKCELLLGPITRDHKNRADGAEFAGENGLTTVILPEVPPILSPMVHVVPLQLLAYHVAVMRGTDVDQPRNLAKSVTVE